MVRDLQPSATPFFALFFMRTSGLQSRGTSPVSHTRSTTYQNSRTVISSHLFKQLPLQLDRSRINLLNVIKIESIQCPMRCHKISHCKQRAHTLHISIFITTHTFTCTAHARRPHMMLCFTLSWGHISLSTISFQISQCHISLNTTIRQLPL
jgi:hypothetical protein